MTTIPDRFGTNLPSNYANLAGLPVTNFGGYDNMPQYLRDLLVASQAAATTPAAAAQAAPAVPPAGNVNPYFSGYAAGDPRQGTFQEAYQANPFIQKLVGSSGLPTAVAYWQSTKGAATPNAAANPTTPAPTTGTPQANQNAVTNANPNANLGAAANGGPIDWAHYGEGPMRRFIADAKPLQMAQGGLATVAEELREKGRHGDSMLAHINPDEARLLKSLGGSGSINPETGLPEYFNFGKILKSVASVALPLVGNAIAPGIGGILGGAAGGALSGGGLEGALMGATGAGLGNLGGGVLGGANGLFSGGGGLGDIVGGLFKGALGGSQRGNSDNITGGSGNDTLQGSSDTQKSEIDPYKMLGVLMSGLSKVQNNRQAFEDQQAARKLANAWDDKQAQELTDFRNKTNAAAQEAYNNPRQVYQYQQQPNPYYSYGQMPQYAKGGMAQQPQQYVTGPGGGQDDKIHALLSNNEYVVPADVVSGLGDGSPDEGAKKMDQFIHKVRVHKGVKKMPPKAKQVAAYMGGLSNG